LNHTASIRGTGNFAECRRQIRALLNLGTECLSLPCSMNGVHQPLVAGVPFYAGRTFYFTAKGLGLLKEDGGAGNSPTPSQIAAAGIVQCAKPFAAIQADEYARNFCFASAYISNVLEAMGFTPETKQIKYVDTIDGQPFGWARGAQLYLNSMVELVGVTMPAKVNTAM